MVSEVTDPADVRVPDYYPDIPPVRASIAQHHDNIHYMDAQVGEIMANLRADDLLESTVVIWLTDHGDGLPVPSVRFTTAVCTSRWSSGRKATRKPAALMLDWFLSSIWHRRFCS